MNYLVGNEENNIPSRNDISDEDDIFGMIIYTIDTKMFSS